MTKDVRAGFVLAIALLAPAAGWAQEPSAFVTEIDRKNGEILIRRAGDSTWEPAKPLHVLRPGDQIEVAGGSTITVVFHGGAAATIKAQSSPYVVPAAVKAARSRTTEITSSLTRFFLGKQAPPVFKAAVTRSTAPTIVGPRETRVMTPRPVFEWEDCDGRSCTIRLLGADSRLLWEEKNLGGRSAVYPARLPALQGGARYIWELETVGLPPQRTGFDVMTDEEAGRVQKALTDLANAGYSPGTLAVVRGGLLFSEGLFADARRELEEAEQRRPDDPTYAFLLAHVYERVGLTAKARQKLARAQRGSAGP